MKAETPAAAEKGELAAVARNALEREALAPTGVAAEYLGQQGRVVQVRENESASTWREQLLCGDGGETGYLWDDLQPIS